MNVAQIERETAGRDRKLVFRDDFKIAIGPQDQTRITEVAKQILLERPRLDCMPPFGPLCVQGLVNAPSLLIEDHSGIQLAHERGADRNLSYRAAMLAGEGDLVAVYGEREPAFEAYCRDTLGFGEVTFISPPIRGPTQSLSQACLADERFLDVASAIARTAGALNMVPYMATGGTWRLAAEVAKRSGVPVYVAGPSPRLVRAVNDKLWFTHWAAQLLGRKAVPHNRRVYGMAGLVAHLRRFMHQHSTVGLKLSHSAASLGNMVLASEEFADLSPRLLAERLDELMAQRGWQDPFPLQLTAWEGPLLGSPSVQLWIPQAGDGPPIVEAVFDQATLGAIARFVGGAPSTLGERLKQELAGEGARLGALFQSLGYFGRCSFDAVVVGRDEAIAEVHWVECNGRWGGMSLPMTLANRLVGDWRGRGFLVFSHHDPALVGIDFAEVLSRCEGLLFRAGANSGIVVLAPGRIAFGGVDCLALAEDEAAARRIADRAIAALGA